MDISLSIGKTKQEQPAEAPQNKTKNVQTGGGKYNPQVQGGNKADGGGNINMGPEIKDGGTFTIN